MAGESAREVARARRAKAERLERMADAFERGAEGEETTSAALAQLPEGWTVLHDIAWPGRPFANIDHVAIGPGGVFVIDSKNWSGDITIRDGVLRQNGRVRAAGVDGVIQAAREICALAQPTSQASVLGVLCFVRDEPLAGKLGKALVCTQHNLVELLTTRRVVLDPEQVSRVAGAIAGSTSPASGRPKRSTTRVRPAKRTRSPSRSTRQKRVNSPALTLVRLAVAIVAVVVLTAKPEIVTSVADAFSHLIVGVVATDSQSPSPTPTSGTTPHHPRKPRT